MLSLKGGSVCNTLGESHIAVQKKYSWFISKCPASKITNAFGLDVNRGEESSIVKSAHVEVVPGWVTSWTTKKICELFVGKANNIGGMRADIT